MPEGRESLEIKPASLPSLLPFVVGGMPELSHATAEIALEQPEPGFADGEQGEFHYRPGSAADFDRLYRSSYPRLKRTLTAVLGDPAAAEDCVQEAFVRAFRAWDRWTPDAPAEAWLHRIALNRAHSYRRKAALQGISEVLRRLGRPDAMPDPADCLALSELGRALQRLPTKLSAAIVLRYYHGYTNRELAVAFGVSERTIGLRLAEAKRRLRREVGMAGEERLPIRGPSGVVLSEMGRERSRD